MSNVSPMSCSYPRPSWVGFEALGGMGRGKKAEGGEREGREKGGVGNGGDRGSEI